MTTIKATFKGTDGSLGYRNDRQYDLNFHAFINTACVKITRKDGYLPGDCMYDDVEKFFQNWTNIKTFND